MTIATNFAVPQQLALLGYVTLIIFATGSSAVRAAHSTCALMQSIPGGEAAAEAVILNHLKAQPPTTFSGKVKVGEVLNQPVKVNVNVTIKDPKDVDLKCSKSNFSYKFGIKARVSGKAGSDTHQGTGRIGGHYTVTLAPNQGTVCVTNLRLDGLNLAGVNNHVDNWIRAKINSSGLVANFPCQHIPLP
ncbi:MAG: hypothetical protein WD823_08430 [Sulfuricaulis sp.]|uniref:hypothetical protein n=1 Tax=Sulfuricaulis sp. TaxID=2003553 RepID=UPI0034A0DCCA